MNLKHMTANKIGRLPLALVETVKLAVQRHRDEVWRQSHPPYLLYGVAVAMVGVIVFALFGVFISQARAAPRVPKPRRK